MLKPSDSLLGWMKLMADCGFRSWSHAYPLVSLLVAPSFLALRFLCRLIATDELLLAHYMYANVRHCLLIQCK